MSGEIRVIDVITLNVGLQIILRPVIALFGLQDPPVVLDTLLRFGLLSGAVLYWVLRSR